MSNNLAIIALCNLIDVYAKLRQESYFTSYEKQKFFIACAQIGKILIEYLSTSDKLFYWLSKVTESSEQIK